MFCRDIYISDGNTKVLKSWRGITTGVYWQHTVEPDTLKRWDVQGILHETRFEN